MIYFLTKTIKIYISYFCLNFYKMKKLILLLDFIFHFYEEKELKNGYKVYINFGLSLFIFSFFPWVIYFHIINSFIIFSKRTVVILFYKELDFLL